MGELKLPPGIVRTIWSQYQNPRRIKRLNNPLVKYKTEYHSFVRALIPILEVAQREKAISEYLRNSTNRRKCHDKCLRAIQEEVSSLSKVVLQNRMALDLLTAKEGGVCTIINQSCCAYINKDLRTDLKKIWEQTKVLHRTSISNTTAKQIYGAHLLADY